jgi:transcriptional coactivator HFI1/ADA1
MAPPDPLSIATFLTVATETFVKELLASVFSKTRSDAPGIVQTALYKKRLRREEELYNAGEGDIRRDGGGLLPVEREAGGVGRTLGVGDVRMSWELGGGNWGLLGGGRLPVNVWGTNMDDEEVMFVAGAGERLLDEVGGEAERREREGEREVEPMDVDLDDEGDADDDRWGWEGGGARDRDVLAGLLDECLAVG